QIGCIWEGEDEQAALAQAQSYALQQNQDLAARVATTTPYEWDEGGWTLEDGFALGGASKKHVVVVDFGVKQSILRQLVDRHCRVTVVPPDSSVVSILQLQPDGVVFSNGPGDPAQCPQAIELARALMAERQLPIFG